VHFAVIHGPADETASSSRVFGRPAQFSRTRPSGAATSQPVAAPRARGRSRRVSKRGRRRVGGIACVLGAFLAAPESHAEEWRVIGSRYEGMAGAGVAVADGAAAAYWNPGALAFVPELFEVDVPIGLSAAAEGDLLENAARLVDFIERTDFDDTVDKIRDSRQLTPDELANTTRLLTEVLPGFGKRGQGAIVTADAGFLLRRGSVVLTTRGGALAGLDPVVDTQNLRFGESDTDLSVDLARLVGAGIDRSAEFTNPASQSLADALAAGAAGLNQLQAEEFVFQAEQAGIDTANPGVRSIVTNLTSGGVGDRINDTGAIVRGIYTKEVGLASGIPLSEKLGLGAHIRYVHATTIYKELRVENDGSNSIETKNRRRGEALAIDVGVLYQFRDWIRFGVTGRNLNRPEFKTRGPHPFELKPQVRAGAALELSPRWKIAVDLDLTENRFETIPGFESRELAIGTEYRTRFIGRSVDIRAGLRRNLASGPNSDISATLGIGLYAGNFLFDLSLGSALDRRRFEEIEKDLPRRIDVSTAIRYITEF